MNFMFSYALGFIIFTLSNVNFEKFNKFLLFSELGCAITFLYLPLSSYF